MRRIPRWSLAFAGLVCLSVFAYWGVWLPLRSSGYDFTGPYEAAYALGHHASLQVYDVAAQRAYSATTLHLPDGPSDFRWTPPMAVFLIPLGLLPYAAARVIWWALGVVGLATSVWLLARCVAVIRAMRASQEDARAAFWPALALLACAAAVMQPVTDSLRLGQSATILLLGFALMAYGEVFDRQTLGGIGLAIAILDKLFPGALLLYFLWRGRYQVVWVALAGVALACLVTLPVTGVAMYGAFAHALLAFSAEPNGGAVNLSLFHALIVTASALLRPGRPEARGALYVALAALVCAGLFAVALGARGWPAALRRGAQVDGETPEARLFAFSWIVTALLALEPVDWVFYYLLALVPLAWLVAWPGDEQRDRRVMWLLPPRSVWRVIGFVGCALAVAPLPFDTRTAAPMSLAFMFGICARPAGILGLWLAHAASRGRKAASETSALALEAT